MLHSLWFANQRSFHYPLRCIEMPRKKILQVVWDDVCNLFTPAPPGVCVQCHRSLSEVTWGVTAEVRGGMVLNFCSQHCAHDYWTDYKRSCQSTSGRRLCGLPGCNKPCYQEGHKTHDYCGRTHAREHKDMKEAMGRDRPKWCSGGGTTHRTSPGLLSRFKNGPVKFYNRGEPYYEFTNFYEAVVVIDEQHWSTTEHYFQAQKFVGTPIVDKIRMLPRPRDAFDTSRDPRYSRWRRKDWEEVKEDVMYKALQAKFTQSDELRQLLMETGERNLIEHSPHDSYWGDGGDGNGKNRLGELLMRLRKELRAKAGKKSVSVPSSPTAPREQKMYEERNHSEYRVTGFNRSNSSSDRSNSSDWPTHDSSSVDPSQHSHRNQHTEEPLRKENSQITSEANLTLNRSGAQTLIAIASGPKDPPTIAMGNGGSQSFSHTCEGQIMQASSVSQENLFEQSKPVNGRPQTHSPQQFGQPQTHPPQQFGQPQTHPPQQFGQPQTQQFGQPQTHPPQQFGQPQTHPPQQFGQPQTHLPQQFGQPQTQQFGQPQTHPPQQFGQPQTHPPQQFGQPQTHLPQQFGQPQTHPPQQFGQPQTHPPQQFGQPQTHLPQQFGQPQIYQIQPMFQMPVQPLCQTPLQSYVTQSSQGQMSPQTQSTTYTCRSTSGSQPLSHGSTTFSSTNLITTPQSSTPVMSTSPVASLPQQSSQPYNHPPQRSAAASSSSPQAQSNSREMPMEH